jgi:hypothetical protein
MPQPDRRLNLADFASTPDHQMVTSACSLAHQKENERRAICPPLA